MSVFPFLIWSVFPCGHDTFNFMHFEALVLVTHEFSTIKNDFLLVS